MKQECWPTSLEKYLGFIPQYKCCFYHDLRYTNVVIRTNETRAKIDRIFLHQMLIEKPEYIITAYTYYLLVRIFGWLIFFNNK